MKYFELGQEHPEQFAQEVQAAHRQSLEKEKPDGTSSSDLS